jgi:hypothetical protein
LTGCAGLATSPPPAIQQQIEAARTPADHQALATYDTKESTAARAKAADHRRMGKAYQAAPSGNRGGGSMPAHCNAAAASYEEIASRFDAMAAEHLQMAVQAKP